MRTVCFYFQVHQPFRLKRYRFFDIGEDHNYFDEEENSRILKKVAEKCYLPANRVLMNLIKKYGEKFKVSFSISGTALEQFARYEPEVLKSFQELVATGNVELLGETFSHSLSSLTSSEEFTEQVKMHSDILMEYFGVEPSVFRNTELIYSNEIGKKVLDMGFRTMLTEGADRILGWKSPNFVYCNAEAPKLKLLLKNYKLSDDIAFRFSERAWGEWPLTSEKYINWLRSVPANEEIINLFMDYETFGEHQWEETGIFDFMTHFPGIAINETDFSFMTPSEVVATHQPVGSVDVPHPISWADNERDLTAWLGNELQDESYNQLYKLREKVKKKGDRKLLDDWIKLQTSDHFYYMCTKFFSDGDVHKYFNPYSTPYEAFVNYMNVLSDFTIRVDEENRSREIRY